MQCRAVALHNSLQVDDWPHTAFSGNRMLQERCQWRTHPMQQKAASVITRIWVGTACKQLLPYCIVDASQAYQLVQVVLADGKILQNSSFREGSCQPAAGSYT